MGTICTIQVSHMNTLLAMDSEQPTGRVIPFCALHKVVVNPATAQAEPKASRDMMASLYTSRATSVGWPIPGKLAPMKLATSTPRKRMLGGGGNG